MLRHVISVVSLALALSGLSTPAQAGILDDVSRGARSVGRSAKGLNDDTIGKGLKEALALGTRRAVESVSQRNGYFNNDRIKILLPEQLRPAADLLVQFGFQPVVDEFVLSMNRAAERAAPLATEHFVGAVREMTFDDVKKIWRGGDTAATEYFKEKTGGKIHGAFKPIVQSSMQEVGVARTYTRMMSSLQALPFGSTLVSSLDLDQYVTSKAVDGLFLMVGEEERKIRRDPVARTTELLRKVFGRR